jgi:hypothetical protein
MRNTRVLAGRQNNMTLNDAIKNAQMLAKERLQAHHVFTQNGVYSVGRGYNEKAVENVFPPEDAYGSGMTCRNGQCG